MNTLEQSVESLLEEQRIVFLGSVDDAGFPNIKAMLSPRRREGIRHIYFSTNTSSMRVEQYTKNPKASLYFCNANFYMGVMLVGTVKVLHEQAIKDQLWQQGDTLYYPLGPTDPDYCVLCFTTLSGRYYHQMKSEDFILENQSD